MPKNENLGVGGVHAEVLSPLSWVTFGLALFLIALPLGYLLFGTFIVGSPGGSDEAFTLDNYRQVYGTSLFYQSLWGTSVISVATAICSLLFGSILAWIIARTNAPGVRAAAPFLILPMMISTLVASLAWIALAAPNAGLLNIGILDLTGVRAFFNIYSFGGMVWVLTLHFSAFAFVAVYGALKSIDASLEEASYIMGVGRLRTAMRMTLPLIFPTLASSFLLIFVAAAENFAVPLVLGTPSGQVTLMSQIYSAIAQTPSRPGLAAAAGTMLLLIALAGTYWQRRISANAKRYVTVGGKGGRQQVTELGRWKYFASAVVFGYLAVAVVLPFMALVAGSFMRFVTARFTAGVWTTGNYERMLDPVFFHLIGNSFILSVIGGIAAVAFYFFLSFLLSRSQSTLAKITEYGAILPTVMPSIVLGIGLLWAYVLLPLPFYGTLWILFIALLTKGIGLGVRQSRAAILQISGDLIDASRVAGSGPVRTFKDIVVPVLRPAVLSIWTLIFVNFFLDVGLSIVLYAPQTMTVPIYLWTKMNGGQVTQAFAIAVLESTIVFTVLFVADRLFGTVRASLSRQ